MKYSKCTTFSLSDVPQIITWLKYVHWSFIFVFQVRLEDLLTTAIGSQRCLGKNFFVILFALKTDFTKVIRRLSHTVSKITALLIYPISSALFQITHSTINRNINNPDRFRSEAPGRQPQLVKAQDARGEFKWAVLRLEMIDSRFYLGRCRDSRLVS